MRAQAREAGVASIKLGRKKEETAHWTVSEIAHESVWLRSVSTAVFVMAEHEIAESQGLTGLGRHVGE